MSLVCNIDKIKKSKDGFKVEMKCKFRGTKEAFKKDLKESVIHFEKIEGKY